MSLSPRAERPDDSLLDRSGRLAAVAALGESDTGFANFAQSEPISRKRCAKTRDHCARIEDACQCPQYESTDGTLTSATAARSVSRNDRGTLLRFITNWLRHRLFLLTGSFSRNLTTAHGNHHAVWVASVSCLQRVGVTLVCLLKIILALHHGGEQRLQAVAPACDGVELCSMIDRYPVALAVCTRQAACDLYTESQSDRQPAKFSAPCAFRWPCSTMS